MDGSEPLTVLVFELDGEAYALPLDLVFEVLPALAIRPLPEAPPLVEGVIDVRGRVLPVLDVRARFGLRSRPPDASEHLVVARVGARSCALRVDRARSLVTLAPEDVVAPGEISRGLGTVAGVARTADGLLLIHDLATFLSAAEAEALEAALAAGG